MVKDTEENHKYFDNLPDGWVVYLSINPTCENLSLYIKKKLIEAFSFDIKDKIKVRVYETYKPIKTSYAEV